VLEVQHQQQAMTECAVGLVGHLQQQFLARLSVHLAIFDKLILTVGQGQLGPSTKRLLKAQHAQLVARAALAQGSNLKISAYYIGSFWAGCVWLELPSRQLCLLLIPWCAENTGKVLVFSLKGVLS
jgi:hypothetical protein